jgi:hypothetical protein
MRLMSAATAPANAGVAPKTGRLQEFIAQEEARGIGSIERSELDRTLAAMLKTPRSKDQTSRSPSRDGSTGKRTRQGNGRHISR